MSTLNLKQSQTSADYSRIEQLGLAMAESVRTGRESPMLDFPSMEHTWRMVELDCRVQGYDIFAAWERTRLNALKLRAHLHWLSAVSLNAVADPFVEIAMRDAAELREKNAAYGESWKRRGGAGAFMMLARKWDRIDNILSPFSGGTLASALERNPGDVLDDIGDLRRYLLLVEDEVLRLEDLPHYGHDEFPSVLFAYINHRGDVHTYLAKPQALVFGSEHYPEKWCLRMQVLERDGVERPGVRHFSVEKLSRMEQAPGCGSLAEKPLLPGLPDIEVVSALVHEAWVNAKRAAGTKSRIFDQTGEELMVPYGMLTNAAQELDRASVRAVYEALSKARVAEDGTILLSPAEVQSGHDRVKWAEGLIRQLPLDHDGRNSWLLNYGTADADVAMRQDRGIKWDAGYACAATTQSKGGG